LAGPAFIKEALDEDPIDLYRNPDGAEHAPKKRRNLVLETH
jgi:hypothetical protein